MVPSQVSARIAVYSLSRKKIQVFIYFSRCLKMFQRCGYRADGLCQSAAKWKQMVALPFGVPALLLGCLLDVVWATSGIWFERFSQPVESSPCLLGACLPLSVVLWVSFTMFVRKWRSYLHTLGWVTAPCVFSSSTGVASRVVGSALEAINVT